MGKTRRGVIARAAAGDGEREQHGERRTQEVLSGGSRSTYEGASKSRPGVWSIGQFGLALERRGAGRSEFRGSLRSLSCRQAHS